MPTTKVYLKKWKKTKAIFIVKECENCKKKFKKLQINVIGERWVVRFWVKITLKR